MSSITEGPAELEDVTIPVKLKLSASWAALMFLYAFGDIFAYFRPGFIEDVMAGEVWAFEINQVFLVAISIYVALPALMVVLSLILKHASTAGRTSCSAESTPPRFSSRPSARTTSTTSS